MAGLCFFIYRSIFEIMIRRYRLSLLGACFIGAIGCSDETVKRTTYETLQNIREKECSRQPSVDCEERDSLEVYEDSRKEAVQ